MHSRIAAVLFVSVSLAPFARSQAAASTEEKPPVAVSLRELSISLERLSSHVRGAVVQIFSTGYSTPDDSDSSSSASSLPSRQHSTGSGVILSADGYIVTNAHVVRSARRIEVRLAAERQQMAGHSILKPAGRTLEAKLVGIDRETDVAVIKIDRGELPFLALGNSDDLRQGELVMAFGNPLGLEGSASMGVVSSTARQIRPDASMIYIQTDAPINPGNSGGPLVDAEGRVMGLNTFILTQSGGSEGIGFAIPSNIVQSVYSQIRKEGHVHRGQLGLHVQTLTRAMASGLGLSQDWGVVVGDVTPGGAAEQGGVKVGDIVLALNGKVMENARQLDVNVYRIAANQKVKLDLLRGTDKITAEVPVTEGPQDPERFADMVSPEQNLIEKLGILCIPIDKKLAEMLPDLRNSFGLVVAAGGVRDLTTGTELQVGDVIYTVNGSPVTSVDALRKKLDDFKPGDVPVFQIERSGRLMYVAIELE